MKAIHSLSKELAEKIEMATKRLNEASRVKDSANKTLRETTLDLFNESSCIPEPETSKDKQGRTMTIQMLLDTPDPDAFHASSGMGFHGLGRISLAGSTEGATALDRQKERPTPLAGGSEELPWITHSAGLRHLNTREDPSNTLQGSSHRQNATVRLRCHSPSLFKAAKPDLPLAIAGVVVVSWKISEQWGFWAVSILLRGSSRCSPERLQVCSPHSSQI